MNGRKAKAIRKIVFQGADYWDRKYVRLKRTGQIINVAQKEEIEINGIKREIPKRRIYRHIKRQMKGVKISQLNKFIRNE